MNRGILHAERKGVYMKNKPNYFIIKVSKMLMDLGSILGLDFNDRVLSFLVKKGVITTEKNKK